MSAWKASKAPDGRTYYWNTETKLTQWNKPEDFVEEPELQPATPATPATPQGDPATDAAWREATNEDGRKYYYNTRTNETTWQAPAAYLKQQQISRPQGSGFVAGGAPNYGSNDDYNERRSDRRGGHSHGLPQKPSFDGGRSSGGPWEHRQDNAGFRGAMPVRTDEPEYGTYDQAEDAFFKMLRKNNVSSDTKWEDALRMVIKEREYRALKDPKERKLAFEKYCQEVRAEEKIKEKERQEKIREDFRKMLSTHDEIKHYTRWKTARPIIEREAAFKSAGDDAVRRQMFDEYILELRKKGSENEIATRKSAVRDLDNMLQALIADPNTKWADARALIMESERFKSDPKFQILNLADVIATFDLYMKSLDQHINTEKQMQKSLEDRRLRQARDSFKQLLHENVQQGKLNAATKWKDFYPLIEKDERLVDLLGNPGSGPMELFFDVVEAEDNKHRQIRNTAMDVLESQQFEFTPQTSLDEFAKVMRSDPRTAKLNHDQVKLTYDKLMEKVKKRAKTEGEEFEKHQRKAIRALTHAIGELRPYVRAGDKYEDVLPRLQGLKEARSLGDDARRAAFDKFIRYEREKEDERSYRERDRDRDRRNGSRRDDDRHRDRRRDTSTPEMNSYEEDRKKASAYRERQQRKPSFGLSPTRDRGDDREDRYRRHDKRDSRESMYDRERRERDIDREKTYISRADPRDRGRALDYGDEDVAGSRPGSTRKRRDSDGSGRGRRDPKRLRRASPPKDDEQPELQSGSEEGEIEEL